MPASFLPSLHSFTEFYCAPKQREAPLAKASWPYGFRPSLLRRRCRRDRYGLDDRTRLKLSPVQSLRPSSKHEGCNISMYSVLPQAKSPRRGSHLGNLSAKVRSLLPIRTRSLWRATSMISNLQGRCAHEKAAEEAVEQVNLISTIDEIV